MSNGQEPIRWDHDDPITGAGRQVLQSAAATADRAFQVAYMIQVMRTQKVQDQLAEHQGPNPAEQYQPPANQRHAEWLNETAVPGDMVIHGPQSRVGTVTAVEPDGMITVSRREVVDPGAYQVIRRPDQPNYQPDQQAPTSPGGGRPGAHTTNPVERPLQAGDKVKALDRGNVGVVLSVDEDTALVRFTNTKTSASRDVPLPTSGLERLNTTNPGPPGARSGMHRPTGRPDPKRIKRTQAKAKAKSNRPKSWKKGPKNGPRKPPKPKP